jgi:hypothetical protein
MNVTPTGMFNAKMNVLGFYSFVRKLPEDGTPVPKHIAV